MKKSKTSRKFGILTACLLSGVLAITCFSVLAANPDLEDMIQEKISERHPTDTPAWWQSLGPEAPKTMISLYEKTSGIYQRLRLVEALGWFHDPDSIAFLKKVAENTPVDVIRNGAIRAVGNAAGASEVDFIGKFLENEDPQTRTAAGQALRKISDPRAGALLQKFYEKETLPWVKDRVRETSQAQVTSQGPLLRMDSKSLPALKPGFAGQWKGSLILPALGSSRDAGLLRLDAQASTQLEGTTGLKGEITFLIPAPGAPGPRSITLQFFHVSGKDTHVSGSLKGEILKEWGAKEGTARFEGELLERGEIRLLKMESREVLLTVVLRAS